MADLPVIEYYSNTPFRVSVAGLILSTSAIAWPILNIRKESKPWTPHNWALILAYALNICLQACPLYAWYYGYRHMSRWDEPFDWRVVAESTIALRIFYTLTLFTLRILLLHILLNTLRIHPQVPGLRSRISLHTVNVGHFLLLLFWDTLPCIPFSRLRHPFWGGWCLGLHGRVPNFVLGLVSLGINIVMVCMVVEYERQENTADMRTRKRVRISAYLLAGLVLLCSFMGSFWMGTVPSQAVAKIAPTYNWNQAEIALGIVCASLLSTISMGQEKEMSGQY